MMILGPEFHRNIWLRFSVFSIVLMPVLIGAGLLVSYLSFYLHDAARLEQHILLGNSVESYGPHPHWSYRSLFVSIPMLFITIYILGTYEAASAFTGELKNKTWDIQKISAIRPIHLVIGKLFGVTSSAWYYSFGILAAILYAYSQMFKVTGDIAIEPQDIVLIYPTSRDIILLASLLIFSAFTGHLAAALGSLRNASRNNTGHLLPLIFGLMVAFITFVLLGMTLDIMFLGKPSIYAHKPPIQWFSYEFKAEIEHISFLLFFTIWGCVAIHRLARKELNFQSYPFVWLLYLTSLSAYFIGFSDKLINDFSLMPSDIPVLMDLYMIPFMIFFFATYTSLFYESNRVGNYLRFIGSIKDKRYKRGLETLPDWIPSMVITFLILGAFIVAWQNLGLEGLAKERNTGALPFMISMVLFLIRDGVVMHICLLGDYFKRGGWMIAAYYAFAYMIFPIIAFQIAALESGGDIITKEMFKSEYEFGYIMGAFYPSPQESWSMALLPVILETIIFSYILWRITALYRSGGLKKNSASSAQAF